MQLPIFRRRTPLSFEICIFTLRSSCGYRICSGAGGNRHYTTLVRAKVQQLIEEDELDPEENLILYGLDSLRIMQFSSELKAQGINISFEELGRTPTLSNWWSLVDARQRIAG